MEIGAAAATCRSRLLPPSASRCLSDFLVSKKGHQEPLENSRRLPRNEREFIDTLELEDDDPI